MLDQWSEDLVGGVRGLLPLIVRNAMSVLGAIAILIIGLWLAGKADRLVERMLARTPQLDVMLRSFFGSLARYAVLTVTVLAVLSQFGIQTTSIVAVLGAAGLAVGLALQGTLSHLAAGVMLLVFRPFKIGNKVQVGGMQGTVRSLSLFWTELVGDDNVQVIVPNGGVWGQPLKNFSTYPTPAHVAEIRIRVPESTDIAQLLGKVRAVVDTEPRILKEPAPTVLFDRAGADHNLEIVIAFAALEGAEPAVKSDVIAATQALLETKPAEGH